MMSIESLASAQRKCISLDTSGIVCEVGTPTLIWPSKAAIYSPYDKAQTKYKYWMRFLPNTALPLEKPLPSNAIMISVKTNNWYWQVSNIATGRDICTNGLTLTDIVAKISVALGEINPGAENPKMSPGHNNAVYCEVGSLTSVSDINVYLYQDLDANGIPEVVVRFYPYQSSGSKALSTSALQLASNLQIARWLWEAEEQDILIETAQTCLSPASSTNAGVINQMVNSTAGKTPDSALGLIIQSVNPNLPSQ